MDEKELTEYIKEKGVFNLPEFQAKFGLSYARAKAVADGLAEKGLISLCADKLNYEYKKPENTASARVETRDGSGGGLSERGFSVGHRDVRSDPFSLFPHYDGDDCDDGDDDGDCDFESGFPISFEDFLREHLCDDDSDDKPKFHKITYDDSPNTAADAESIRREPTRAESPRSRNALEIGSADTASAESGVGVAAAAKKFSVVAVRAADELFPHEYAAVSAAVGKPLEEVRTVLADLPAVVLENVSEEKARRAAAQLEKARITAAAVADASVRLGADDDTYNDVMSAVIMLAVDRTRAYAVATAENMLDVALQSDVPDSIVAVYKKVYNDLREVTDDEFDLLCELYFTD